jgi:hypothetical protein
MDKSDIVPQTQRDVDALALFEELHSAEKERLKSQRKLAKSKQQLAGSGKAGPTGTGHSESNKQHTLAHSMPSPMHSIALETKKEIDAFALFEELQRAETERLRALRSGMAQMVEGVVKEIHHAVDEGTTNWMARGEFFLCLLVCLLVCLIFLVLFYNRADTISILVQLLGGNFLSDEAAPSSSLAIVPTTQKERDAIALLEDLQRAEQERKMHGNPDGGILYTVDVEKDDMMTENANNSNSNSNSTGDSVGGVLKAKSQKRVNKMTLPKSVSERPNEKAEKSGRKSALNTNSNGVHGAKGGSEAASPTLGQERFWVYFDLEREQKNSVLKAKEITLQAHLGMRSSCCCCCCCAFLLFSCFCSSCCRCRCCCCRRRRCCCCCCFFFPVQFPLAHVQRMFVLCAASWPVTWSSLLMKCS